MKLFVSTRPKAMRWYWVIPLPKAQKNRFRRLGFVLTRLLTSSSCPLLFQAVRCFARGILDVACRLMQVTLCLVGLAFLLQFLIAADLASTFLYSSFGFVGGAFNAKLRHVSGW
jgi:hypothetical protein